MTGGATALALAVVAVVVTTVVSGTFPPWGSVPPCDAITATAAARPARFVDLAGAVPDVRFTNTSRRSVTIPPVDRFTITGTGGTQYQEDFRLAGDLTGARGTAVAPGATRGLAVGILRPSGAGREDVITIRVDEAREGRLPFLHCEVEVRGVAVELAQ